MNFILNKFGHNSVIFSNKLNDAKKNETDNVEKSKSLYILNDNNLNYEIINNEIDSLFSSENIEKYLTDKINDRIEIDLNPKNNQEGQDFTKIDYNLNSKMKENLEIEENFRKTFPIVNNNFNFLVVDSNLAIKENLNNIFFIEFDLKNENDNCDFINLFTEINNEKVNKDISFTLNVL